MLKINEFFDLQHTLARDYLQKFATPWLALSGIKQLILDLGPQLSNEYKEIKPHVWVHESASIFPSAYLGDPCIIGPHTEVRQGSFIRGSALVGADCVIGNSVELKNVILFDHVQVPHYNYVGDSILGYYSHMGAGSITSNMKSDHSLVWIKEKDKKIATGLKKMGAIVGDHVEVGCNSVLNPGTVIEPFVRVYPLTSVRGYIPQKTIVKKADCLVAIHEEN